MTDLRRVPRLLLWFIRVAVAAAGGALLRLARRAARREPRIWHGILPLHMTPLMVKTDRAAGFPSRSVVLHLRQSYALLDARQFDAVFEAEGEWFDAHWRALTDLLWKGDIWSTQYDGLFFKPPSRANRIALWLIRLVGIRIIVSAHGGDVLHQDGKSTRFEWVDGAVRDYPMWDLVAQGDVVRERLRLFDRYADLVFPGDSMLRRFLRRNDLMFKYFPVDTDEVRPVPAPAREVPLIIHAPNHRMIKGTDALIDAVEQLRQAGIRCELRLVEGVPHGEALAIYAEADIIADQFRAGAYGVFALEGMALGKPVLTYLDAEHLTDPHYNLPLVNANPENLAAVLAVLVQVPELRARLGRAGRNAVERVQSVAALAEVWRVIYDHVWWGKPLDLSHTAHFDPARGARSLTENPGDLDFWPVECADLHSEIDAAFRRFQSAST